jgi:PEP-CTERM motif
VSTWNSVQFQSSFKADHFFEMNIKTLALSFLVCSASAFATTVSYTTTGQFTLTSTSTEKIGDATIKFAGTSASVSTPTFSSLGTFIVTDVSALPANFSDTFTLTISQTLPTVGSGSSSTTVSGTISKNSSVIELTFVPSFVHIGTGANLVTYKFAPDNYGLNNPSDNDGATTVEAYITSAPEPASLGLLGGSLIGLGVLIRRRAVKK